jgi:oxygen-independent coproporphyrinogen-3 oxidase
MLKEATKYFDNISIDLIYGVPGMSNENGDKISSKHSLRFHIFLAMRLQLTQNGFEKLIQTGKIVAPNDDVAQHFMILGNTEANNFIHYELSNFKRNFSKNNSAYWLGKKIGIGPSAHSYDGVSLGILLIIRCT